MVHFKGFDYHTYMMFPFFPLSLMATLTKSQKVLHKIIPRVFPVGITKMVNVEGFFPVATILASPIVTVKNL